MMLHFKHKLIFREFYEVSDELNPQCLLVRCHEGKKKNVYFTSPVIRNLVISNEDKVKIINTGVKTFVRCDNKNMTCAFRLAQEGLNSISHFIGKSRKIEISKDDLITLLQNNDHQAPPEISKLSSDTQEKLENFGESRSHQVLNMYLILFIDNKITFFLSKG